VKNRVAAKASARSLSATKNWWRDFFIPVIGEVMFAPKAGQSEIEVDQIIRRSKVSPPLAVLDLACGIGRHSTVFSARGFEVTGLDYSKPFLRQARKAARAAHQTIRFVHGDMRNLRPHFAANTFDLAVCLYTSFGYFARRSDDLKTLRAVYRVLRPGGAFVVNTINGGGVAKRLRSPVSIGHEPIPNVFVIDQARYDVKDKRTITNWIVIDARRPRSRVVRRSFRVNVYSHAELRGLLIKAGFKIETVWGMLPGGRFDPRKTWHQTILARKP
jgi:SAM-dependent methyltransferase